MVNLFLNSIAGSEVFVILLFVLIFFGAKSIPGMSRSLGRGIRQIKDASADVQNEIRKTTSDMKNEMNLKRSIDEVSNTVKNPLKEISKNIRESTDAVDERYAIKDGVPHQKKTVVPDKNQKNTKIEGQKQSNDSASDQTEGNGSTLKEDQSKSKE